MPKTKLEKRVEWIKKIKSYRNPECSYPWSLSSVGYCWGYALLRDKFGTSTEKITFKTMYKKWQKEHCEKCEYWEGNK